MVHQMFSQSHLLDKNLIRTVKDSRGRCSGKGQNQELPDRSRGFEKEKVGARDGDETLGKVGKVWRHNVRFGKKTKKNLQGIYCHQVWVVAKSKTSVRKNKSS